MSDLRERVARAIANVREGGWPADTYALLQQHYLTMADAALAEIGGVQRCAECDCDNPPDGCNWIAAEPAPSVREAALKAQIHRLTAAGDNLTAWVDDRGTPDVRKWDKARDEAFRAIAEGKGDE